MAATMRRIERLCVVPTDVVVKYVMLQEFARMFENCVLTLLKIRVDLPTRLVFGSLLLHIGDRERSKS